MGDVYRAATSGDRLAALRSLRNLLARTIKTAAPQYVAPLARQLTAVLAEIDALSPSTQEASAVDELAKRRADRRSNATREQRPPGGDVGGQGGD